MLIDEIDIRIIIKDVFILVCNPNGKLQGANMLWKIQE